jgi:hypothetical protein
MRRLAACWIALALVAGPAVACINDAELPNHEREFRSHYRRQATPPSPPPSDSNGYGPAIGAGFALLVGGAAVAMLGGRKRI